MITIINVIPKEIYTVAVLVLGLERNTLQGEKVVLHSKKAFDDFVNAIGRNNFELIIKYGF